MDAPAIVQQVESRTDGVIREVAGRRVTVTRTSGQVTTFTLTAGAELYLDGRRAALVDIRAGQRCRVIFNPATLDASFLTVYVNIDTPPR